MFILKKITAFLKTSLWSCLLLSPLQAHALNIVVTLNPFYSLTQGVIGSSHHITLLLNADASPHDYALKPSEVKLLTEADVIIWGGPHLESFLNSALKNAKANALVIQLDTAPNLELLAMRGMDIGKRSSKTKAQIQKHSDDYTDPHFWLDPMNAIVMADMINAKISEIDPKNSPLFSKNTQELKLKLLDLDTKIKNKLQGVLTTPFIVFHDAYQYFEYRYGLFNAGALSLDPEIPLSAKQLNKIRASIERYKVGAIFSEPQFSPRIVHALATDLHLNVGVLDPLGRPCANGYMVLLDNLSDALVKALHAPKR